jgi:hypothetical protein
VDLEHVKAFIAANKWKFASSMPWIPHWYVVREKCDEEKFVAFVRFIREHGTLRKFGKRTFVYLDYDGFTYCATRLNSGITPRTSINNAGGAALLRCPACCSPHSVPSHLTPNSTSATATT